MKMGFLKTNFKIFLSAIVVCGFSSLLEYLLYRFKNKTYITRIFRNFEKGSRCRPIKQILFFTDKNRNCREHYYKNTVCSLENCTTKNVRILENLLDSCSLSIEVCMYLFTFRRLTDALVRAHKRGVVVRVITDYDMAVTTGDSGCQVRWLQKYGIDIHTKQQAYLMHHKFVILDKILLINGSANWTLNAFAGNWENLLITTIPDLVIPFQNIFETLWEEMEPLHEEPTRNLKIT